MLTCARAGAGDVAAVEENAESIAGGKRNAAQNGLSVRWIEQDVFQFLRAAEKAGIFKDGVPVISAPQLHLGLDTSSFEVFVTSISQRQS